MRAYRSQTPIQLGHPVYALLCVSRTFPYPDGRYLVHLILICHSSTSASTSDSQATVYTMNKHCTFGQRLALMITAVEHHWPLNNMVEATTGHTLTSMILSGLQIDPHSTFDRKHHTGSCRIARESTSNNRPSERCISCPYAPTAVSSCSTTVTHPIQASVRR